MTEGEETKKIMKNSNLDFVEVIAVEVVISRHIVTLTATETIITSLHMEDEITIKISLHRMEELEITLKIAVFIKEIEEITIVSETSVIMKWYQTTNWYTKK